MLIFLVIVSLSLNILAFIIIAILFLRQNKLFKMEDRLIRPLREMEELTSAYLLQMKDENDRFIRKLYQLKEKENGQHAESTSINHSELKKNGEEYHDQRNTPIDLIDLQVNDVPVIKKTTSQQAAMAYQKQIQNGNISINADQSTNPRAGNHQTNMSISMKDDYEKQIIHFKKQGYSIEDIAKKLNKGKTEIELLLKFKEKIQE